MGRYIQLNFPELRVINSVKIRVKQKSKQTKNIDSLLVNKFANFRKYLVLCFNSRNRNDM